MYTFYRRIKIGSSWRCIRRGCLGRLVLKIERNQILVEISHYHDEEDDISTKIKPELTKSAKNTNEKFYDVLMSALNEINEEDRQ
jgi:hypothetical protein